VTDNEGRAPHGSPANTRPAEVAIGEISTSEHTRRRYDPLAGHRRRREAAKRLPPLPHSRRRDPLTYAEVADCRERDR
jgi:hypothetical protein